MNPEIIYIGVRGMAPRSVKKETVKPVNYYIFDFGEHGKFSPDGHVPDETDAAAHNMALSQAEIAAFKARKGGDRWFAYWHEDKVTGKRTIRTWMGEVLATVRWAGAPYRLPTFGRLSERVNFRADGIDGCDWSGTYYKSSGSYVRMRVVQKKGDRR